MKNALTTIKNFFQFNQTNKQKQQAIKEAKRIAIFTTLHPWKSILIMTIPMVLAQLILASYNIMDKMIATNFGMNSLINEYNGIFSVNDAKTIINVATGYAGVVYSIAFAFSLFIALGTAIKVSISLGAKDQNAVASNIFTGQILSISFSILVATVMWFAAVPIIKFQSGTDSSAWNNVMKQAIFDQALRYSRTLTTGMIIVFAANIWIMLLRTEGRLLLIITLNLLGFLLNIAFDFALVFRFGMIGTAFATVGSWIPYLVIPLLFVYFSKHSLLKFKWSQVSFDWKIAIAIISIGSAALFENIAQGFLGMFTAKILSSLPNPEGFSSHGAPIYAQINSGIIPWLVLINAPIIGIGYGARALVGYVYGAKNYSRIWDIIWRLSILLFSSLVVLTILVATAGQYMLQVFGVDPVIAANFKHFMTFEFMFFPLATITYIGLILFQSMHRSKTALFISLQRTVIVPTLCLLVGGIIAHRTNNGFYFFLILGFLDLIAGSLITPILIYAWVQWKKFQNHSKKPINHEIVATNELVKSTKVYEK